MLAPMYANDSRLIGLSPISARLGFRAEGFGRIVKDGREAFEAFKPRVLGEYALVQLVEGGGFLETAVSKKAAVRPGEAFILFPGVRHRYGADAGGRWTEYWCIFSGYLPEAYAARVLIRADRPLLRPEVPSAALGRWKGLFRASKAGASPEELSIAMGELFSRLVLSSLARDAESPGRGGIVEEMLGRMAASLGRPSIDARALAADLGCGYSWARRQFARRTGFPPERYYARLVAAEARERLLAPGAAVKEVGLSLGFADPYHFSRFFKRQVGQSPKAFRESYRGWMG
jgi:AraC-like DNA-binding protein